MTDYTEAGVRLIADVSDAEDKIQGIIDLADSLTTIEISVSADTSEAEGDLSSLADETVEPTVTPTYDDTNVLPFDDLADADVEPTVTPTISDDGQTVLDTLKSIELMTAINLVIDISGSVISFLSSWSNFTAGPLLAIDTGMAEFTARTGAALPNARELITKIMGEDLATGVTQITAVLTTAQQLGLPLESAATAALTFTKVFPENDPNTVLNTLDSMVKNNLVPDLTAGSDLLVAGFQQGANKGGDLLSVLGRNASAIKDLGLTGPSSIQLITNALAGGASSATDVVTELEKIKQNITTQTTTGKGTALDALQTLGLPNPITSGQGWTADFFTSVSDALNAYQGTDAEKQQLFSQIVGGKLSQKDYQGFLNIDAAKGAFDDIAGTGQTAATKIDDSLSGAINDFVLAAQVAATNFLSSDQIDLPGKMAALKTGIQDGLTALQNGDTLGGALTIALKPVGLDQTFLKLEAAVLQFTIAVVSLVAGVQELTGHGDQAKTTLGTVSSLAGQKLALDLQINNPADLAKTLQDAFNNGLTADNYGKALQDGVSALVNSGDFAKAQALLDESKTKTITLPPGSSLDPTVISAQIQSAITSAQGTINSAVAASVAAAGIKTTTDTATLGTHTLGLGAGGGQSAPDIVKAATDIQTGSTKVVTALADQDTGTKTLTSTIQAAQPPTRALGTATQQTGQSAQGAVDPLHRLIVPISAIPQTANPATLSVIGITQALPPFTANLNAAAISIQNASAAASALQAQGGAATIPATAPKHASGTEDTGGVGFWAGEDGPEYITSDRSLAVLNNRTMSAIMQAVSGAAGRGGVSNSNSSKVVNFTQINTVPDKAVASTLGYETAAQIRGV